MKKKKRTSATKLARERQLIMSFYLKQTRVGTAQHFVFTEDLFKAYKKWRRALGRTPLSVDGFGRMLPKFLPKKSVMSPKGTKRAVFGVRLK